MSGGISAATIATYAAATSAVVGLGSALYQGSRQSKMADYQTGQAAADASTAQSQAQVQARQIRTQTARQQAVARATLADSGVTVGTGTAEQVDQTIGQRGEQDALTAIYQGDTRAKQIQTAGNLAAAQSENASTASVINGVSTALSGFATVAKGWNVMNPKGVS